MKKKQNVRWPIDDISDVPRFFCKKNEPLFFLTVISGGNVFPLVITVGNRFPLVITVGNTFPPLITVGENNGSSFFQKKRGTSKMSSMGHRKNVISCSQLRKSKISLVKKLQTIYFFPTLYWKSKYI